jgi:C1A family cysteine protease
MDGNLNEMRQSIALSYPVVFGFSVYDSFMSDQVARTGIYNEPKIGETYQGGHAVVIVGYDNILRRFKVRNSWGLNWGQQGYVWMPYSFVGNPIFCNDFWTIKSVVE